MSALSVSAVPDIARVKSWKVRELNGWVYVWYHAEGEEPYWYPPEIDEITKGEWTYRGRTEHIVNAQIQVTGILTIYSLSSKEVYVFLVLTPSATLR